jgi:hypothetical protein
LSISLSLVVVVVVVAQTTEQLVLEVVLVV